MERDFQRELTQTKELVEARLTTYFPGAGLQEAMRYSLLAGGKRIRPILTIKFCEAAGGKAEEAMDFACGIEMLHTYSLIHDDLPCMDNDALRRGKPTCHKVYGECVATLAGDALQAAAFQTVLCAKVDRALAPAMAAGILAAAAGESGMCGGQYYDTLGEDKPRALEELAKIHDAKTGALLRSACMMGVVAALGEPKTDDAYLDAAKNYATHLGLAFQIQDDILDATSTTQELGKPVGSDAANHKTTFVTLLGVEECRRRVRALTQEAKAALGGVAWRGDTDFLCWLADQLAQRSY